MRTLFISFAFLLFNITLSAQDTTQTFYPNGIYHTIEDFFNLRSDTTIRLKRVNLGVPLSKAFQDTIVDHVWFLGKNNDPLKEIFAVGHGGRLYLHDHGIKSYMAENFTNGNVLKNGKNLHRLQSTGTYYFLTVSYDVINMDVVGMGLMFGLIGQALYSEGTGRKSTSTLEVPIVFHPGKKIFYSLHTPVLVKNFMDTYHPDQSYNPEDKNINIDDIRNLISMINEQHNSAD